MSLLQLIREVDRADVLEAASHEAYATGEATAALELALRALDEHRRAGDELAVGRTHRWLSRIHWFQGHRVQAEVQAQLAVKALEHLPPSVELAWAYSNLSQLAMLAWRREETLLWGERSIALARDLGADDVLVHALVNVGRERMRDTTDDAPLWEAVAKAEAVGEHHEATRGMIAIAFTLMDNALPERAALVTERALRYAERHEEETLRQYLVVMLGRIAALEGRWVEAERVLRNAVDEGSAVPLIVALGSLALVQVRRGDEQAAATLERAWPLAEAAGEPQRIVPLAEVEAERAWLQGRLDPAVRRLQEAYAMASRGGGHLGRLARWLQEAGALTAVPPGVIEPYRAELEGRCATRQRTGGHGACRTRRHVRSNEPAGQVGRGRSSSRNDSALGRCCAACRSRPRSDRRRPCRRVSGGAGPAPLRPGPGRADELDGSSASPSHT